MKTLLEVKNLSKNYSGRMVVSDLSFNVERGEIIGLLGPNGAGKTTAFYMTIGLIKADGGSVFLDGVDVSKMPIHKRAKLGMAYLSQEPSVFRELSVEDNILCILETLDLPPEKMEPRLEELLTELHLTPLRAKKACTLSGGERRRLEITRALIREPKLLLLDEPFANIDPLAVADVKHLIRHLKNKNISVLITDHNAREIFSIVDKSYLIQGGQVMMCGTMDELLANAEAKRCYFGEDFRM